MPHLCGLDPCSAGSSWATLALRTSTSRPPVLMPHTSTPCSISEAAVELTLPPVLPTALLAREKLLPKPAPLAGVSGIISLK